MAPVMTQEPPKKVIAREERLDERNTERTLSKKDSSIFLKMIDSKREPNQALRTAASRYKKLVAR